VSVDETRERKPGDAVAIQNETALRLETGRRHDFVSGYGTFAAASSPASSLSAIAKEQWSEQPYREARENTAVRSVERRVPPTTLRTRYAAPILRRLIWSRAALPDHLLTYPEQKK
jgi:hypothetical protein